VRTLAGAVDHFASRENDRSGNILGMIDERLDEISRAIVASTVAAQASSFDPESLERIEKRIDSLATQIEEVATDRTDEEVIARLNMLSARVDDLAAHSDLPQQAVERLSQQIALIADRIDQAPAMPDPDYLLQGLEQRFEALSNLLERRQGDALEQSGLIFQDLEQRLHEVAARLDERAPAPRMDGADIMEAIDARFTALAQRLENRAPDAAGAAAIRNLETRLEDISARLDASATQVASIDPQLIRSLEAQVTGLSTHLSQPGTPLPEFEDIAPRLNDIERSLAATQDSIVRAARDAAENAVRTLAGSNIGTAAVTGLTEDLKMLETLTRRSDERNAKTFEAIHDTLLKIVDRLGSLEKESRPRPCPSPRSRCAMRPPWIPIVPRRSWRTWRRSQKRPLPTARSRWRARPRRPPPPPPLPRSEPIPSPKSRSRAAAASPCSAALPVPSAGRNRKFRSWPVPRPLPTCRRSAWTSRSIPNSPTSRWNPVPARRTSTPS